MAKHETSPHSSRRNFLNSVAAGAATIGLASLAAPISAQAAIFEQTDPSDPEAWTNKIKGKHKMVFDVPHANGIYPFGWPRVFLMTNEATGAKENECCAVVVFRHTAIPYAFDHSMWEKYNFGEVFDIRNEEKQPLTKNPFWQPAKGTYKIPGIGEVAIGINELQNSGVMFSVCNMAISVFTNTLSAKLNKPAEEIKKDWMSALLPGIQPVPSGIWAVGRAQEKGCTYVFAG